MSSLALLQDLQTTLDLLRTIERDLAAFPPELAAADTEAKALQVQVDRAQAALAAVEKPRARLQAIFDEAKQVEMNTRSHLKEMQQQIPYAEALKELGEKERAVTAAAKPLKEMEAQLALRQADLETLEPKLAEAKACFETNHAAFLTAHENQVVARTQLQAKEATLWKKMEASLKPRVERLIQQRQGRLIAAVDAGVCGGCRTKLRTPLVAKLREERAVATELIVCESCQRYLFLP